MVRKPLGSHEPYTKLPHHIQTSPAYVGASSTARALLLDVIYFERGRNNGCLLVTISKFRPLGWTSHQKFYRALTELVECGLLIRTSDSRIGVAAHYALAWMPIMKPTTERSAKGKARRGTNAFPESGKVPYPNRERSLTRIGQGHHSGLPESGEVNAVFEGQPFPIRVSVACCQGGEEEAEPPGEGAWVPGDGPPMTVYVAESGSGITLAVRPSIQQAPTTLCIDASEPDAVMAATCRALAIATQHNACLRLVGTTEALARFKPILATAKAGAHAHGGDR